ncbi:MAG: phage holin family protein [Gemmatimonadota bacterium]|nr:phage holin family protein [Gemmatimonadota bacterium]
MPGFLARTLITAFGLWLADVLLAGVHFDGALALFIAALLLGLTNAFIRPIVVVLTLPITLLTLGFFLLVVNGLMVLLVAYFMPSFHLEGLWTAILASIIVGLTGWAANAFIGEKGTVEVWRVKRGGQ